MAGPVYSIIKYCLIDALLNINQLRNWISSVQKLNVQFSIHLTVRAREGGGCIYPLPALSGFFTYFMINQFKQLFLKIIVILHLPVVICEKKRFQEICIMAKYILLDHSHCHAGQYM